MDAQQTTTRRFPPLSLVSTLSLVVTSTYLNSFPPMNLKQCTTTLLSCTLQLIRPNQPPSTTRPPSPRAASGTNSLTIVMICECARMEFANTAFDNLYMAKEVKDGERMEKMQHIDNDDDENGDAVFKSKNLQTERRRRKKLSDRLLELRSLMTKEAIITDAITYIEELQKQVGDLSYQLHEMEGTPGEEPKMQSEETIDAAQEMEKWGIKTEVDVGRVDEAKLWIKIVYQKKKGAFTKLMEAMSILGLDLNDTSVTSSRGALLVTSCVEATRGGLAEADKIREFLLEIIRSI